MIYNGVEYFYVYDLLGNVIALMDATGSIVVKYIYDAWGNQLVLNPNNTVNTNATFIGNINPYRYRGYRYDVETNLYYLNARYYDPSIGRYISNKDIDNLQSNSNGINLFVYATNSPINIDVYSERIAQFYGTQISNSLINSNRTSGNSQTYTSNITLVEIQNSISSLDQVFVFMGKFLSKEAAKNIARASAKILEVYTDDFCVSIVASERSGLANCILKLSTKQANIDSKINKVSKVLKVVGVVLLVADIGMDAYNNYNNPNLSDEQKLGYTAIHASISIALLVIASINPVWFVISIGIYWYFDTHDVEENLEKALFN